MGYVFPRPIGVGITTRRPYAFPLTENFGIGKQIHERKQFFRKKFAYWNFSRNPESLLEKTKSIGSRFTGAGHSDFIIHL